MPDPLFTTYSPPGPEPDLAPARKNQLDEAYDEGRRLVLLPAYALGYFTHYKGGEPVHPTRESMEYASLLAFSGDDHWRSRGSEILEEVLMLQDLRPRSSYFGVWPWFSEESVDEMDGVDYNWANFMGAFLVDLIAFRRSLLRNELQERMLIALEAACVAITKRKISAAYTNICAMSAAVLCAGGEILGNRRFFEAGRQHLEDLYLRASGHLVFDEYNSSAYTPILIEELDRLLRLVNDGACRKMAESLRSWAWRGIAFHFHPELRQWGGAQARSYMDHLGSRQNRFLEEKVGLSGAPLSSQPCPEAIRELFRRKTRGGRTMKLGTPHGRTLTLYKTPNLSIGTVDEEQLWVQCRPLMIHFKTSSGVPGVVRMRVMMNGRDYAGATLYSCHSGRSILAALSLSPEHGIWHRYLDHPANGRIVPQDLRIRFEMTALGSTAQSPSVAEAGKLQCDDVVVRVHPMHKWLGKKLRWETYKISATTGKVGEDQDNWFPTKPQGGDAEHGAWLDAVVDLDPGGEIQVEDWTKPSFSVGLEVVVNDAPSNSGSKKLKVPKLDTEAAQCAWHTSSQRRSLEILRKPSPPSSAIRSWRDPYWRHHPFQFIGHIPLRLSSRFALMRRLIARFRRVRAMLLYRYRH